MRIGVDGRYAFRAERRGIGEYVAQILGHLAEIASDEEFFVYVDRQADIGALRLPSERFQVRRLDVANPVFFEEAYLPRAAAHDHLDLLHLTANYGPTFVPCPTVYTVHDVIEFLRYDIGRWQLDWRHRLGRGLRTRTLPRQVRRAEAVIAPSQASKHDIVRVLGVQANRVHVVPHGTPAIAPTDTKTLRQDLRRRGYAVPEHYFMAFAALDPRKNGEVLIQAFSVATAAVTSLELWLTGIEDLGRYPRSDFPWLHLYGYLAAEDARDLMRAATGFIYLSRYEGFGFPALEAMAAGVPLIASSSSSIPEVVGDGGILVDPDDTNGLARAIVRLAADDELRQELKLRGIDRAAQFRWQDAARLHLAIYRRANAI